jgi:antitoxin component YwqK of YwqJK toxin-antitoxin module
MKIFLVINLLFILLFSNFSYSQENPYRKINKTYYPDGTIKTEGDYLYDKLDGHYKEFYPNGNLWKDWN